MRPPVLFPALLLALAPLPAVGVAPCGGWEQVHPWPTGDAVTGIAYGNGRYVAVGSDVILDSEDGVVWTPRTVLEWGSLQSVVWADGPFLAVGGVSGGDFCVGTVAASPDGVDWQAVDAGAPCLWGLAWNGESFVAVGYAGWLSPFELLSSPDGKTWASADHGYLDFMAAVAWGNGVWVVAGEDILYSRDAESWEEVEAGTHLNDVLFDGRRFVAVGAEGVMTSTDGLGWTASEGPTWRTGLQSTSVASNGRTLIAVGTGAVGAWYGPGEVASSVDGVVWSSPQVTPRPLSECLWAEGQWLAVGSFGLIGSSVNGLDWVWHGREGLLGEPTVFGVPGEVFDIESNGSLSIAVGIRDVPDKNEQLGFITTSSDTVTWVEHGPVCCPLWDVDWDGSRWLAVGRGGTVLESADGVEWSEVVAPDSERWYRAAASSGSTVVVVGDQPVPLLAAVVDGQVFDVRLPFGEPLDVIWTGSRFVVVGVGVLGHSADGRSWTFEGTDTGMTKLAFNGQRLVAVGGRGVALWSDDAMTWNQADTGGSFSELTWAGDSFVAGNQSGAMVESVEGVIWSPLEDVPIEYLSGLAWTGRELVAVGRYGGEVARRRCGQENLPLAALQRVVPVVAHRSGVGGSFWRSDLQVVSTADEWTEVWVSFGSSNTPEWRRFFLPPGGQLDRDDVVERTFGEVEAARPLLIAAERPVAVTSRTFTEGMLGTYGQEVPALAVGDVAVGVTPLVLPLLEHDSSFRTNLGLVNVGAVPIALAVELVAADGRALGSLSQELGPFGLVQLDAVLAELGVAPVADAYAVVSSSDPTARFAAYASVVDNQSQDPAMVIGQPASSEPLVIPAAAHGPGSGDTFWQTDLEVVNADSVPAAYDLELLAGDQPISVSFELPPGQARRHHDIVDSVFERSGTYAIVVTPTEGVVAVASRTFTTGAVGTFGQAVPAVRPSSVIEEGETALLPGLAESGDASGTRTNLGLVNLGEEAVTATVEVFRGDGQRLKTLSVPVPARSLEMATRVFARCGGREVESGYLVVRCSSPGGRILAWASVVDNLSGDPVFIPAQVTGE